MNRHKNRFYLGIAIIVFGVLALLVNTNLLSGMDHVLGGGFLVLAGFFFFTIYNRDRSRWWPLLPGTVLVVLGIGVLLESFVPFASDLIGAAFMYAIFAVFAFVFSRDRQNWWAVIPAGVTFTLGTIVLIDSFNLINSDLNGVIFFLGISLTFFYLWSLRQEISNLDWAIWPAGALIGLAFFVYLNQVRWMDEEFIFPLIIIVVGVIIIVTGSRRRK